MDKYIIISYCDRCAVSNKLIKTIIYNLNSDEYQKEFG